MKHFCIYQKFRSILKLEESLKYIVTKKLCTRFLQHETTMVGECIFFAAAYWFLWTVVGDSTRGCASPGRDK